MHYFFLFLKIQSKKIRASAITKDHKVLNFPAGLYLESLQRNFKGETLKLFLFSCRLTKGFHDSHPTCPELLLMLIVLLTSSYSIRQNTLLKTKIAFYCTAYCSCSTWKLMLFSKLMVPFNLKRKHSFPYFQLTSN